MVIGCEIQGEKKIDVPLVRHFLILVHVRSQADTAQMDERKTVRNLPADLANFNGGGGKRQLLFPGYFILCDQYGIVVAKRDHEASTISGH